MIPFAKLPDHSVLRERERTVGGLAEVGSPAAAAVIARVRAVVVREPKRAARDWNNCRDDEHERGERA